MPNDNPDMAAQEFIDSLAAVYDNPHNNVTRFTPSIKLGRRYLHIEGEDGFCYMIQLDVVKK
jgi:hypothetical protein